MLAISFSLLGQQVSLHDLIARALDENYQVRILNIRQQMAGNENTLGNAGFLPSLNVGADRVWGVQNTEQRYFSGDVRSGDNARSSRREAFIELDWTVFDGFRMFATRNRLAQLEQLSHTETRFFIEQTIADIIDLYYQLIMERQLVESLRNTLEISAFRLKLEDQKRTVGIGNALLYHQALIDFNSDSTLVVERERMIRDIQIQINQIINEKPGTPILPEINIIEPSGVIGLDELLEKISGMNSQLERVQLEEMITESNIRIERAARYPQVSVFGNYSYVGQTNEVGFVESSTVYGAQYGVRVRFNLYDGGRLRTRLRNASLQQEIASVSVSDTRSVIESHLAGLLNAYDAYIIQLRLIDSSVEAARSTMAIAQEQLQEGVISGFDFRQTQLTALRVENQRVGILYALKSIETDILRLSGELAQQFL